MGVLKRAAWIAILPFLAAGAQASVLYDNGPTTDNNDALLISNIWRVSDSFTLSNPSTITGVGFTAWVDLFSAVTSVGWSVSSTRFGGGTIYGSGDTTPSSGSLIVNSNPSYVYNETLSFKPFSVPAGTLYLTFSGATAINGSSVGWDVNDGPSHAWQNPGGTFEPSETFQILGRPNSAVPEPLTLAIMASGLLALGLARRRRLAQL